MKYVMEALDLEDIVKNYEQRSATGWFASHTKYFPSLHSGFTRFQTCVIHVYIHLYKLFQLAYLTTKFEPLI